MKGQGKERHAAEKRFICSPTKDLCLLFFLCLHFPLPHLPFVPCPEEGLPLSPGAPRWMKGLQACTSTSYVSSIHPHHTFVKTSLFSPWKPKPRSHSFFSCCFFGLTASMPPLRPLPIFYRAWCLFWWLCLCPLVALPAHYPTVLFPAIFLVRSLPADHSSAPSQCLREPLALCLPAAALAPPYFGVSRFFVCVCACMLLMSWQVCFKIIILILREPK